MTLTYIYIYKAFYLLIGFSTEFVKGQIKVTLGNSEGMPSSLKLLSAVCRQTVTLCLNGRSALNPFHRREKTVTGTKKVMNILQAGSAELHTAQVTLQSLSETHQAQPRQRHVSGCFSVACWWVPLLPAHRWHQANPRNILL